MKFFQQLKNVYEVRVYAFENFDYNMLYADRGDAEEAALDIAKKFIDEYEIKKKDLLICDTDDGLESITDVTNHVFEIVIDEMTITPKKERY